MAVCVLAIALLASGCTETKQAGPNEDGVWVKLTYWPEVAAGTDHWFTQTEESGGFDNVDEQQMKLEWTKDPATTALNPMPSNDHEPDEWIPGDEEPKGAIRHFAINDDPIMEVNINPDQPCTIEWKFSVDYIAAGQQKTLSDTATTTARYP